MQRSAYLYLLVGAIVVPLWLLLLFSSADFGIDFYPLYFAANRIRHGLSPYGAAATTQLVHEWIAPFATAGVAYPLPLILLVVPFSIMPFTVAAITWTLLAALSSLSVIRLQEQWQPLLLLPLLFLPFFRSVSLAQATLVWFGLAAVLVAGIRSRQPWLVGILCALLVLKPQNGLFFAIAGLVWGFREQRSALWWFFGTSSTLSGLAFVLQPTWLQAWITQLGVYQSIVQPPSLLPLGLVLIAACWRLPWWARVAAAQVACFPLSDLYSGLPLLFCWVAIGGPLALVGASLSWLWSLGGFPNTVDIFWWLVLLPLLLCAIWRTWVQPKLTVYRADRQ